MLVKYTGNKPEKIVEWRTLRSGTRIYVFKPTCEVDDQQCVDWLMHPDKQGLFELVLVRKSGGDDVDYKPQEVSNVQKEAQAKTTVLKVKKPRRKRGG